MRKERVMTPSLRQAIVVLVVCFLALFMVDIAGKIASSVVRQEFLIGFAQGTDISYESEEISGSNLAEESALRSLSALFEDEPSVRADELQMPSSFATEAFDVEEYESVYISQENKMIGFWAEQTVNEVDGVLSCSLEEKGWLLIPSERENVATYIKEEGVHKWMLVQFVSVNQGTSVVIYHD